MIEPSKIHNDSPDVEWFRPPGFPRRLDIRVTQSAEPRDGYRIYAPQRRIALLRYRLGRLPVIRSRSRRQAAPPWRYEQFAEIAGIAADSAVAMRSSANGRWIVGLEHGDRLVAVAKCGSRLDAGLRWEAQLLAELEAFKMRDPQMQIPIVLAAAEVDGCFALVTKAAPRRTRRASLQEIGEMATRLTNGCLGVPLLHGDLAQWNVINAENEAWLVDWEHGRRDRRPMWDLANHLVGEGVLVGRYSPQEVAHHLIDEGSVGWNHLSDVHENPLRSRELALEYLDSRPRLERPAEQFYSQLRRHLQ